MDKILNRICHIENHPVSKFDAKHRLSYLKGLGSCLFILSKDNPTVKLFFEIEANCIDSKARINEYWAENISHIKEAISLQRNGIHFFYMKDYLFFDCFNTLKDGLTSEAANSIYNRVFRFFQTKVCGIFSKRSLNKTFDAFKENRINQLGVGSELKDYVKRNEQNLTTPYRILVVANVSAGKSTLINALIGYRINKTKTTVCTNKIVQIENKLFEDGITTYNGTSYNYYSDKEKTDSENFLKAALTFDSELSSKRICFIDTPGINNIEDKKHREITENAIEGNTYDAVIYVSNCQYFGTNDEKHLLSYLKTHCNKPIIFVLNQLDRFKQKEDSIDKMLYDYNSFLQNIGFKNPRIFPVSARAALLLKIPNERLDEDDSFDKEIFEKKFKRDYYNLPRYQNMGYSSVMTLNNTGITSLEKHILNIM